MKKKLAIILAVLIVTTFTGCKFGGKSAEGNADYVSGDYNGGDMYPGNGANPPNGNWNDASRLTGEVESVNGQEVTLKIIDMPGFGGMGGRDRMPNGEGRLRDGQMRRSDDVPLIPDMASGAAPRMNRRGDMASGDAPRMNRRGDMASGNAPRMDMRGNMASGAAPRMEMNYTGETKTVKIPDGISITKMTGGYNGGENNELTIGDVKAGDIMTIWFSDESQSVVERVSISNFGKREQ